MSLNPNHTSPSITSEQSTTGTSIVRPPLVFNDPAMCGQDFHPKADENCFCGSNKLFKHCCGSIARDRPPPYGVFLIEHYLDENSIRSIVDDAHNLEGERLMVIDHEASTADKIVKVEDERRVTERVPLGDKRENLTTIIKSAFQDMTQTFTGHTLEWFETPDLMRYRPGGLYIRHADSQNYNAQTQAWEKVIDRDFSFLLYLNDDFQGGALHFVKFNYHLQPKAGMAVLFPSDNRYMHEAEMVTEGVRYAVVSWGSARGVPKLGSKPPEPAILYS